ncbi:DUF397 domain-containing protein [Streptomyces sp. HNM0575]|uniref:DUF397 domain-containing protein n=1 Tax=Streptomyces sp. HNM0575 TaxID=2716338 RepID=UPI00145FCE4A|nr:DUF397 domain-containing protein [Streptomyces sp. HNM0575]NLU72965.1 DUF397 domain-containing protein [Streptomyces sp. HNM0575]
MNAERNVVDTDKSVWFKSSYSGSSGGDCVEVAALRGTVHVRDSKSLPGPVLCVQPRQWAAFLAYAAGRAAR